MTAYGCHVLLLLLGACCSSHAALHSHDCSTLFIAGSLIQPGIGGYYHLQKYTYNGRLVYRHSCSSYFLYHGYSKDGTTSYWQIGEDMGDAAGYVRSDTSIVYPRDVTSWMSWSNSSSDWVLDPRMFVSCTDVRYECQSFIFRGPDVPEKYKGPYDSFGLHDNHVSYKHRTEDIYVFHSTQNEGCTRWIVGNKIGDNRALMQCLSNSDSIFSIKEQWTIVHSKHNIQHSHSVQAECTAYDLEEVEPECGERLKTWAAMAMLLGGSNAYPGKWPFMASYKRADGQHKCGGALLNRRWILTSGHCVSGADTSKETIVLGAYNLDSSEKYTQSFSIKSTIIHPQFTWIIEPFRMNYDIALVELDGEAKFSEYIQPICLPPFSEEFPFKHALPSSGQLSSETFTQCYMVGWGRSSYAGGVGGMLQDLGVSSVLTINECYKDFYASLGDWITQSKGICLFAKRGGRMCKGDSGSPMFCQRGGRWSVLGLGGWSLSDCVYFYQEYPSVYTDLSVFTDWITASLYGNLL